MSGLFDTFTVAKRGLSVQQGNINTTSHNIANVNTDGYSRQRAVAETTKPFGGMSRFDTVSVGQVGTGAEITSIQRIRDLFIDYQVRSETGTSGFYTQANETLSKVEDIFGEPSDKGIQELTNQFFNAFQEVSKNPSKTDVKTVAIQKASALADALNYTYNQLKKTTEDGQKLIQSNVTDVNSYLDQINELNKQIRSISAVGQTANDLMDKRDLLLDKLSNEFGIKLDRDNLDTINLSSTEYPDSALVKSDPNDINYNRFSYVKSATLVADPSAASSGGYKLTVEYYPLGNENATVKSFSFQGSESDLKGIKDSMLQNRMLIADKDGNVTIETSPASATGTASVTVTQSSGSDIPVSTTTTSDGKITMTIGTGTTAVTITKDEKGVITNTSGYDISSNVDGTMYIKLSSDVTIGVGNDGTITVPAENLKVTSNVDLKKTIFQTYAYDGTKDAANNTVNNVDNNNIKGVVAANQSVQNIINGYMDSLDKLAAGIAYSVNAIQTGSMDSSTASQGLSNNPIFVKSGTGTDDGITAATIKINSALSSDPNLLNCNTTSVSGYDGKRANAIANINIFKMNFGNVTSSDLANRTTFLKAAGINTTTTSSGFSDGTCLNLNAGTTGSTVDSYYKTIINNIAVQTQEANRMQENQQTILANLENQKDSVSGVSLDEETTNLIQYQHAYQANAKMISTIDELLDVVINGLKK